MNVEEVTAREAKRLIEEGWALIDVRSPAEWRRVHAEGSVNLPLDLVTEERVRALSGKDPRMVMICESGARSKRACKRLHGLKAVSVAGGTSEWLKEGLPYKRGFGAISIERQVRIGAGFLVFIGTVLGFFLAQVFFLIPLFVGMGLIFAGITDFCGMGLLLAKMPWNQGGGATLTCGADKCIKE